MKVKCVDNKRLNKEGLYQSLTVGNEYIVLAIEFYDKSISPLSESVRDFALYRLRDNDGIVIPFPSKIFEIITQKMPSMWVPYQGKGNIYSILPKTWARSGFWEDFYNDEDGAIEDFKKAEREIISEG